MLPSFDRSHSPPGSADSGGSLLPDDPFTTPVTPTSGNFYDTLEPLSTKRETLARQSSRARLASASRALRSAPVAQRTRFRVLNRAHELTFKTPPNTPVDMRHNYDPEERSKSAYCQIDHECTTIPIRTPYYDRNVDVPYLEQCFDVEMVLGEGSFGQVVQARSREDGHRYAVKRANRPFRSPSDRALMLREVKRHEDISPHPNIINFYRAWEERGTLYIQTELCVQSLTKYCTDFIAKNPNASAIPTKDVWNVLYDMLNALDYLHSRRLVHLDIKPENMLLTSNMVCKLGDFGLIFDLDHDHASTSEEGDCKYVAGELLANKPTQAADIFSLGISILEISTDMELPSNGQNWQDLRDGKLPERFRRSLDPQLLRIVQWMMSKNPGKRPTAHTLINDHAITTGYKLRRGYMVYHRTTAALSFRWEWVLWQLLWLVCQIAIPLRAAIDHFNRKRLLIPATPDHLKGPPTFRMPVSTPLTHYAPAAMRGAGERHPPPPRFNAESDMDSPFHSDDEGGHDQSAAHRKYNARDVVSAFYADSGAPRLRASNSPFRGPEVDDESPTTSRSRRLTRSAAAAPSTRKSLRATQVSPSPLPTERYDDGGFLSSAHHTGHVDEGGLYYYPAGVPHCQSAQRLPPLRLDLDDSDSDGDERFSRSSSIMATPIRSMPCTPNNSVAGRSGGSRLSSLRRTSGLRASESPRRLPKLDFSILDRLTEEKENTPDRSAGDF